MNNSETLMNFYEKIKGKILTIQQNEIRNIHYKLLSEIFSKCLFIEPEKRFNINEIYFIILNFFEGILLLL
jgi:hypothetical protein